MKDYQLCHANCQAIASKALLMPCPELALVHHPQTLEDGWSLKLKVVMASPSRGICYLIPLLQIHYILVTHDCRDISWYLYIDGAWITCNFPISISVFRQWEQRLSGPGGGGLLTTQNNHLDSIKRGKGDSDSLDQAIDLSVCTQSAMTLPPQKLQPTCPYYWK